jgi:acylphosphatase
MSTHVSHRDVWYTGHVQGVGFRAQVLGLARGYDVTGFVQNLTDGRVYLHAEGDEGEVEAFTDQIAKSLDGHIRGEEIKTFSGLRTCREFAIRR